MISDAASRSRASLRERVQRLVTTSRSVTQIMLAAPAAWFVATEVLDHDRPFFAPVAAIVTLGLAVGERARRAVEIGVGVTLGIVIGDLIVLGIGTGTLQLALVLAIAMLTALLLGSGQLFAQQAAVSAALVVTIQPPTDGLDFTRTIDALVGSGLALLVHLVLLTGDPLKQVRATMRPLMRELAAALEDVATALATRDLEAAEAALLRTRAIEERGEPFLDAVTTGRETARMSLSRRRARAPLDLYADAAAQIDLAQRNARVLARAAYRAIRFGDSTPPGIPDAVRDLAAAARAVESALDAPSRAGEVRIPALRAAGQATLALEDTGNLSVASMVSQVRSTAVDLLRSSGMSYDEAVMAVRRAAREAAAEAEEPPV